MSHHNEWKSYAQFIICPQNQCRVIKLKGQVARTLDALIKAGSKGVTALEMSSWAFRLGAYVHTLRDKHGLSIKTLHEPHESGWHGRYVLHDRAERLNNDRS